MKLQMSNKPLSAFSFSSLTDIVMLLLIFFLLTSQFVIQTGVKVKLPGAKNNEEANPSSLVVTITERNQIYFGSDQTSLEMLAAKLSTGEQSNNERNLIIKADKKSFHGVVVDVMDAAKVVGIEQLAIATDEEEKKPDK